MKETDIKINKIIQELLYGGLKESRQAKKELIKEIEKMLKLEQGNTSDSSKNREFRKKTVLQIYDTLFLEYKEVKKHNKCTIVAFLGHSLFYFNESPDHYKQLLEIVFEALKDKVDGSLRQSAVLCGNSIGVIASLKNRKGPYKYSNKEILIDHLGRVFDYLEIIIEKDIDTFPVSIDTIKPSVIKSFLLYISQIDRFSVVESFNIMYEGKDFYPDNEYNKEWKLIFGGLIETHPNLKKFVENVLRFDIHKFDDDYYFGEYAEVVDSILEKEEKGFVPSEHFFAGIGANGLAPGGWSIPSDSYFEIMDIINQCDENKDLLKILDKVYIKAHFEELSNIFWFDIVVFIMSKIKDFPHKERIWKEIISKLSAKVDIKKPISDDLENGINALHYGIHEHRPIFRILLAFAIYNDDLGNKEIAKDYYMFLLKLNSNDNQGVRYLLASLYAGKPASYTDTLFEEGNKNQNWDNLDNFLEEQNKLHKFWNDTSKI